MSTDFLLLLLLFGKSGGASRWRVCYQQGLPRLVLNPILTHSSYIFRCYFNKYFSVSEFEYLEDRETFVSLRVKEHSRTGEVAPSPACARWSTDAGVTAYNQS